MNNRKIVFDKLVTALGNEAKAKNIEIDIFNWSIRQVNLKKGQIAIEKDWSNKWFKRTYLSKSRSILFNITNLNNTKFKEDILNGSIKTKGITGMTAQEVFPELWKPILVKIKKREETTERLNALENTPDGPYQCDKCESRKIIHSELQTRSADEPMTIFFNCLKCQHRWKDDGTDS